MNIKEFKEGDIITRSKPMVYAHSGSADGSYTGERITFVGVGEKSKIITYVGELPFADEASTLSYARDAWDEGWEYYPESLIEKAKKYFKKQI